MRRPLLAASALVLPLTMLLFAQWPLRDVVQAGSRQANDLAQVIFAIYMAVAITAAGIEGLHLAARHAPDEHERPVRWRVWAVFACTAPWALFVLWTSTPNVWQSVRQLERFGETLSPGYFLIRVALWLLAALVLAHGIASVARSTQAR
ncbi:MAG TPA: C4-dicarboxylate ABC transporter substrate-binding protein [Ramlibacter sp.]|nr:C4-dicarboxylate ABC transporter substrate-binding protein [Ramlibacter sp.]